MGVDILQGLWLQGWLPTLYPVGWRKVSGLLIISKYHDYYDTAIGFGIDKTCVYKRAETTHKSPIFLHTREERKKNNRFVISERILGFCGKIFPIIRVRREQNGGIGIINFFYSAEEFIKFLVKHGLFKDKKHKYAGSGNILCEAGIRNVFDLSQYKNLENLFRKYSVPTFYIKKKSGYGHSREELITNFQLKKINFQRIVDPYTAFQEIYMFISGVLGNTEKDTSDIDDKVKAQQKGFNKLSFRSQKGDKKPRRSNRGKGKNR
jgi:hypothetical protein